MPDTDKSKEKKSLSSLFAKKETDSEPKEKKSFSSLFAKKETDSEPKEKKSFSSLFAKKETDSEPKEKKSISSLFAKKEKPVFEEPPQVLELPPFETEFEVVDRYWLTLPYAYANLYRDNYGHVHYQMVEPKLS